MSRQRGEGDMGIEMFSTYLHNVKFIKNAVEADTAQIILEEHKIRKSGRSGGHIRRLYIEVRYKRNPAGDDTPANIRSQRIGYNANANNKTLRDFAEFCEQHALTLHETWTVGIAPLWGSDEYLSRHNLARL